MPITRKQFEQAIDEIIEQWMLRIHSLLSGNREKAYNEDELKAAFGSILPTAVGSLREVMQRRESQHPIKAALAKLIESDAVEMRIIHGTPYYAYKGDLGL